ncbi:MAG: sigma-70 family RNA polymerase sigma factor [Phycisphaerae bacterium]|jgi:RNA polymerase sigma factor (sigma-70 family)|nr:sigma-70 family RNA polymerase sigma factor [Phycisphaerae bacterium]
MDESEQQWRRMIDGLRGGDPDVIEEFVAKYGHSLERIADNNIATQMGRRFGGDDVVQSVCRTFLRRVEGGQFELDDSESLWRLLCAITLTKVREKARFHMRKKRSLGQEVRAAGGDDDERGGQMLDMPAGDLTPSIQIEFADTFEHLISQLDDEERIVVDMKLQQKSNAEIASELGSSERTVRRILARLMTKFETILD